MSVYPRMITVAAAAILLGVALNCASHLPSRDAALYNQLKKLDQTKATRLIQFDCPDDPAAGSLKVHGPMEKIGALVYSTGYAHGFREWRFLLNADGPAGTLLSTGQWTFDPARAGPKNRATIETLKENLYVREQGKFSRAYTRSARAFTRKGEKIAAKIKDTRFRELAAPKPAANARTARLLLKNLRAGRITKTWCGLEP